MINVNDFFGKIDSDILENAIKNKEGDGIVLIPPRKSADEPNRDWWLLDRAILLPKNTTVILQNCKIKLSDKCRDNFFRTDNCGMGIEYPQKTENIHIKGIGLCVLEGADRPRATGDGSKILKNPCPYLDEDILKYADWISEENRKAGKLSFDDKHAYSFGTDAGTEESQYGDWRGIGILFANLEHFSIENIKIVNSHGWGISLEACTFGSVKNIEFDACMSKETDGMPQNMENQDGLDLRNGCHDIIISDITGKTGDDLVALTAIASNKTVTPGGSLRTTHVMHNDWSKREKDIYNITIRNLKGTSQLCFILRLLPCETQIRNIIIDGIVDTTENPENTFGTILLGEPDSGYGRNLPDSIKNIVINNVISNRNNAIGVAGYVSDSSFSNIINKNPHSPAIDVVRAGGLKNVLINNVVNVGNTVAINEQNK